MALPTSGALSLGDIHVEASGSGYAFSGTSSLDDADIRGLSPASGYTINSTAGTTISIGDFYGASASQNIVVTQGSSTNPYTSYYGFKDSSPAIGSRSPTGYTNASGTLRTVTALYALGSSAGTYFYLNMSHSTANSIPADDFDRLTMLCNGVLTTLTAAEAYSTTIAGGYQRSWFWSTSYGMNSTEQSNIATEWDGSGNITVNMYT